ncbi:MAG: hypothetical protein EA402_14545 [Planctomycetota bacterium]|nr:MAG: hypothetical protein EA402_14545 [Planctomycetota bacterium]
MTPFVIIPLAVVGAQAPGLSSGALAALAIALVIIGVLLFALEFFVVSGGFITALAGVSSVGGIVVGFYATPALGWVLLVSSPLMAIFAIRFGLRRLGNSRLVIQAELTEDAGYHHLAESFAVKPGVIGTLSTDAMPTGRCHFDAGELDVSMESGSGRRGDRVRVLRIDGPEIVVIRQPEEPPAQG